MNKIFNSQKKRKNERVYNVLDLQKAYQNDNGKKMLNSQNKYHRLSKKQILQLIINF